MNNYLCRSLLFLSNIIIVNTNKERLITKIIKGMQIARPLFLFTFSENYRTFQVAKITYLCCEVLQLK